MESDKWMRVEAMSGCTIFSAQIWTPTAFVKSSKAETFLVFDIFANCMRAL